MTDRRPGRPSAVAAAAVAAAAGPGAEFRRTSRPRAAGAPGIQVGNKLEHSAAWYPCPKTDVYPEIPAPGPPGADVSPLRWCPNLWAEAWPGPSSVQRRLVPRRCRSPLSTGRGWDRWARPPAAAWELHLVLGYLVSVPPSAACLGLQRHHVVGPAGGLLVSSMWPSVFRSGRPQGRGTRRPRQ